MRVGVATDHGRFPLKEDLVAHLRRAGNQVHHFGPCTQNSDDDCPDVVIPLAQAVAGGQVDRGIAICGSGIGVSDCANKIPGVLAALINDTVSARQGVQDEHPNVICVGRVTVGPSVARDLVRTFLTAEFSQAAPQSCIRTRH